MLPDALAAERGVPAQEIVEKLLTYALEEGAVVARRMLRADRPRLELAA